MPNICSWCKEKPASARSQFCSIRCRIACNDAVDKLLKPDRARCATDGCERPTRTKKSLYCKECYPKVRVRKLVETIQPISPGRYQCHWCPTTVSESTGMVNHLNEDYADMRPENRVISCRRCYNDKRRALFFLDGLVTERFNEFGTIIMNYRQRRGVVR